MQHGLSVLAIGAGAALGANLRWLLGLALNSLGFAIPLGTLSANLLGAWLIGIFTAEVLSYPDISFFWRLFFVTGFLGALTTFSSFAAEMVAVFEQGQWLIGITGVVLHVLGSLLAVVVGMASYAALRQLF